MSNKDVEKILNDISCSIFKSPISVEFRINESEQVVITANGIPTLYHLKDRVTKKASSKNLIDSITRNSSESKNVTLVVEYLKNITGNNLDWNKYIDRSVDIEDDIVDKARKELREHINGVKEIYIIPIEEKIESLNIDKSTLNKVWKDYIVSEYDVVEKIDSFRSYSTIKKSEEYPYLVLSSKTGKILLTKESTGHYLKVENIETELSKIKETERIINKCGDNIKPFLIIKEHMEMNQIKCLTKIENSNEVKEYGSKYDCENFYSKRITSYVKVNLIEDTLIIKDKKYSLNSIKDNADTIYSEIDKLFELAFEESMEHVRNKLKLRKEKFNKPYMTEILNLIYEFPLKGITTYVSILHGEESNKITSNDYDTSQSYKSMSDCSKTFITNKIKEFIDNGVICEGYYKASFGRYIGLSVSEETKKYIDSGNMCYTTNSTVDEYNIDSIKSLISKLRGVVSTSKARALLISLHGAELTFKKKDLSELLNFIESNRNMYREYEEIFIKSISSIIPVQYKPIFLLNSNMTSGVTKKTLKSIYDNMKDEP